MRTTLMGLGAFLFLAYPLVLLFAVASKLEQTEQKPATAAIILTPRSSSQLLERESAQRSHGVLRDATIRTHGN